MHFFHWGLFILPFFVCLFAFGRCVLSCIHILLKHAVSLSSVYYYTVLFTGPSLLEINFLGTFPLVFAPLRGIFQKETKESMTTGNGDSVENLPMKTNSWKIVKILCM